MSPPDARHEALQSALAEVRDATLDLSSLIGSMRDPRQLLATARFLNFAAVKMSMESTQFTDREVFEKQNAIREVVKRGVRQLTEHVSTDFDAEQVAAVAELLSTDFVAGALSS
ncbi:MAG: hypothetical protein ACE37F_14250 [Nannocystaceae bacterium]|nr:hypothetical protein [bacterium]